MSGQSQSAQEKRLVENVVRRVRLWDHAEPYYSDKDVGLYKTAESRGTEAVLNALILVSQDTKANATNLDTQKALDQMWSLQETSGELRGSWPWLAFGHEEPWEADDSSYYGACLAAIAAGGAREKYRSDPNAGRNIQALSEYLKREYAQQSLINRVTLLWAASELPGLIEPQKKEALIREIFSRQQSDGGWQLGPLTWKWRGWTLASFGREWIRSDGSLAERGSDGYATAFIALVLPKAGISFEDPHIQRAVAWLVRNQSANGSWPSYSVNKRRDPLSNTGRFMSDAATAYAVLALTSNGLDDKVLEASSHSRPSSK